MSTQSSIEWTEITWNPVTGCSKVSEGCRFCYAERMATRLKAMGQKRYVNGFTVTLHADALEDPFKWKNPRVVFVNSMSDLFHENVSVDFIKKIFEIMARCPRHTFQILTKRSRRLAELSDSLPWPSNVWIGVSVENIRVIHRIHDLKKVVSAKVRFLSCEPLLGPLTRLPLDGINWVIVGGESGPKARPIDEKWVKDILTQCESKSVPFFFKQWGGVRKDLTGRLLDGRIYDQMPPRGPVQSQLQVMASL